jgi:hypothetical protein
MFPLQMWKIHHVCIIFLEKTMVFHIQWEFQDPKMEVLYHIRPYFVGYSLT